MKIFWALRFPTLAAVILTGSALLSKPVHAQGELEQPVPICRIFPELCIQLPSVTADEFGPDGTVQMPVNACEIAPELCRPAEDSDRLLQMFIAPLSEESFEVRDALTLDLEPILEEPDSTGFSPSSGMVIVPLDHLYIVEDRLTILPNPDAHSQ